MTAMQAKRWTLCRPAVAHQVRIVACGLALVVLQGCTALGAGIGAGIDRSTPGPYEEHAPDRVALKQGDWVMLVTRSGARSEGRFAGTVGPTASDPETYLVIERRDGQVRIPTSDLRSVGVDAPSNGWIVGASLGLAADVVIFLVLVRPLLFKTDPTPPN